MAEYAVGGSPYIGGDCGACDGNVTGGGGMIADFRRSDSGLLQAFYVFKILVVLLLLVLAAIDTADKGNEDMKTAMNAFIFIMAILFVIEEFFSNVQISTKSP